MFTPPLPEAHAPNDQHFEDQESSSENAKGELALHTLTWLNRLMASTGIIALITAAASLIFVVNAEEAETHRMGNCVGNCYVVAEVILVVAIVAFIALKVFVKLRG